MISLLVIRFVNNDQDISLWFLSDEEFRSTDLSIVPTLHRAMSCLTSLDVFHVSIDISKKQNDLKQKSAKTVKRVFDHIQSKLKKGTNDQSCTTSYPKAEQTAEAK